MAELVGARTGAPLSRRLSGNFRVAFCTLVVLAILAMASACNTLARDPDAREGWVGVPVRFINSTGLEIPARNKPDTWFVALGIIPGGIVGTTNHASSLQAEEMHAYDAQVAEFNFSNLRTELTEQSTAIDATATAGGLKVEPAETHFGRVTTVIGYSGKRLGPFEVGFRDKVGSKYSLFLVFFDRPCRLTGTLTSAGPEADVTIEKAGLTWMQVSQNRLTVAPVPAHVMFVVQRTK